MIFDLAREIKSKKDRTTNVNGIVSKVDGGNNKFKKAKRKKNCIIL